MQKKDSAFKSLNPTNNLAGRAVSAGFVGNPKLARYEDLTIRLKQLLAKEKRNLRVVKTMIATEIETTNKLEKYLRMCVDDVKAEISKKRNEKRSVYSKFMQVLYVQQTKLRTLELNPWTIGISPSKSETKLSKYFCLKRES